MRRMRLRTMIFLIALIATILALGRGVIHWNKAEWCRGIANDYLRRATACLEIASDPALSAVQAQDCRDQADLLFRIANRYMAVADRPWLPYPSYPLLPEFAGAVPSSAPAAR